MNGIRDRLASFGFLTNLTPPNLHCPTRLQRSAILFLQLLEFRSLGSEGAFKSSSTNEPENSRIST